MEDGFAGPARKAVRGPPSPTSRTQRANIAITTNALPVPSSSLSASLLDGGPSDPEYSGVAGIDATPGRPPAALLATARAAPREACEGPACVRQVAKAHTPASMTSAISRGEATLMA